VLAAVALEQFAAALALDPRDGVALRLRGWLHPGLGVVLRAEADYKAALALDPRSLEASEALAGLYVAQKLPELAARVLQQALALHPDDARLLVRVADLSRERGDAAGALPHYQAAAKLAATDATPWMGLGLAQQALGRHDAAAQAFREAMARDPHSALVQYRLGVSLLEGNRPEEALGVLQTAAARSPMRPEAFLALGRLYRRQGLPERATEAYQRALRADPANTEALKALDELWAAAGPERS